MFKSIKTGVLAVILISAAIIAQAQKKITEGILTYEMTYSPTTEQEEIAASLPKETIVKFKDNLSKVELSRGPALLKIIGDKTTKTGLLLIDLPIYQKQFAVKMSKEDIEKSKEGTPNFSDFKATGEKQKIGIYNTEKYTYKDNNGAAYELWSTTDFELPEGYKEDVFKDVKGTLVKFTIFQNGVKSTLTLKNLKEEKIAPLSLEIPEGYELKTMKEMEAMQRSGQ